MRSHALNLVHLTLVSLVVSLVAKSPYLGEPPITSLPVEAKNNSRFIYLFLASNVIT
jgi:hypothetical protein